MMRKVERSDLASPIVVVPKADPWEARNLFSDKSSI